MKIATAKAAILTESRKPLIVDEIAFPETLDVGQVLVKVLYSTICGARSTRLPRPRDRIAFCLIFWGMRRRPWCWRRGPASPR